MSPAGWTDNLEHYLGRWAVPYLTRGLVAMNAGAWLLNLASPGFSSILKLEPALILQGEYWRLLTTLFSCFFFSGFSGRSAMPWSKPGDPFT